MTFWLGCRINCQPGLLSPNSLLPQPNPGEVVGGHTVFDPTRTLTSDPGRLTRQFFVGWRTMIAGVVGAEGAFRGADVVCDIVMRFEW